jgi:hypothetical protein
MELTDLLTKNLGVSQAQANGGAGLLFKQAKEKLGTRDFSKISAVVPGIDSLISVAPASGGSKLGALGKLASGMGGKASGLGSLANLAGGFSTLGLDNEMIGKFVPVILSFVQGKGSDGTRALLEKAFK